jgi:16S rRNA (adenine1518-N6/adenine1519-N6)-dimethyltransferase
VARRLGQHFLKPPSVARLLRVIRPKPEDVFLEIGPGRGALTIPLAERAGRVVAVELDRGLAATLRQQVPANVLVVEADALRADLRTLVPAGSRLVGNLPYYISSPLLRRFLELRDHVTDLHVMLQEEVARRVAAPPGSKEYGILSVLYGLHADLSLPLRFPPGSFLPPPRVDSAVLRAVFLETPRTRVGDPRAFEKLVQTAFGRRRRTLENNLQDSYPNLKQYLRLLNITGSRRAETLSVVEFGRLAEALSDGAEGGRGTVDARGDDE